MKKTILTILLPLLVISSCRQVKEYAYNGFTDDREKFQKSEQVLKVLNIASDNVIADLGAGAGYFTFQFTKLIGNKGMVYAVDPDPDMIKSIKLRAEKEKSNRLIIIQSDKEDSRLPENSFDLIFMCNVHHHIRNRVPFFKKLKSKLKSNGKIAIIEVKPDGKYGLFGSHGTKKNIILKEMIESGYKLDSSYDILPEQNFQIFTIKQ